MDEEIELERDSDVIMKLNPEEEALYNEIEIAPAPRRRAPPRPTPRSFRSRMEPEEPQEGLDAFMNPHKQSAPPPIPDEEYPEEEMYEDEDEYVDDDGGYPQQQSFQPPRDQPSSGYKSIDEEKADLLNKLTRLEKKGFTINKKLSMYSPVDDIRSEVKRITYSIEVDQSVKFSRRMLVACVTGLEFLNEKYSPLDIHLKGWSESVMENINDYDNVFEELYAKYRTKMQVAPEIKLILMLSGSAMMYHLTSTMFKTAIPNVGDVLKQNPELVKNMMSAVQTTAANNMASAMPQPQAGADGKYEMQGPGIDISSLMGNIMMPPPPPMSTSTPVYNPEPEAALPDDDDVSDIVSEKGGDDGDDEDQVKEVNVKPKSRRSSRKKKTEINL